MKLRTVWGLLLLWMAIVAISLAWNLSQINVSSFEFARLAAESQFEQALISHSRAYMHDAVNVPSTAEIPPITQYSHPNERQLIITSGKRSTLADAASMTSQTQESYNGQYGVQGYSTSLSHLPPESVQESGEPHALLSFGQEAAASASLVTVDKLTYLRVIRPLKVEETCLECHAIQGSRPEDMRGGISVSIPFGPFQERARQQHGSLLLSHGVIGLFGLLGLWAGGRRQQRSRNRLVQSLHDARRLAARSQVLLSSLGEGIYGTDCKGICIYINPAALDLLGFSEAEVIGRNQQLLFHAHRMEGETYPSEECPVFHTLQDGKMRKAEDVFIRKDGTNFPVSLMVKPILDEGVIEGAIVSFRDITEHRLAEEALKKSSEELRRAQGVAHVGSWHFDIVANELSWSEETYRIFGIPPATSLTLETFINTLHPDDQEKVLTA